MSVRAGLVVATQVMEQVDSLRIELLLHRGRLTRLVHRGKMAYAWAVANLSSPEPAAHGNSALAITSSFVSLEE